MRSSAKRILEIFTCEALRSDQIERHARDAAAKWTSAGGLTSLTNEERDFCKRVAHKRYNLDTALVSPQNNALNFWALDRFVDYAHTRVSQSGMKVLASIAGIGEGKVHDTLLLYMCMQCGYMGI
jgi:hypothetical protein